LHFVDDDVISSQDNIEIDLDEVLDMDSEGERRDYINVSLRRC